MPGKTIPGSVDNNIQPGYLDITQVSTSLDGTMLTVVFTLRELPEQLTINRKDAREAFIEISWEVAIDVDNDLKTGGSLPEIGSGIDAYLGIGNIKFPQAKEKTEAIAVAIASLSNPFSNNQKPGSATVDLIAKTITVTADIPNIKPDSYLVFFTTYDGAPTIAVDRLCTR